VAVLLTLTPDPIVISPGQQFVAASPENVIIGLLETG